MSFGKEFSHEVHILLFKGWFLIQKLARGLQRLIARGRLSGSFTLSLKGNGVTKLPLSFLMNLSSMIVRKRLSSMDQPGLSSFLVC